MLFAFWLSLGNKVKERINNYAELLFCDSSSEWHIPDGLNAHSDPLFGHVAHIDADVPTCRALWLMTELCSMEPGQTAAESDHRAGLVRPKRLTFMRMLALHHQCYGHTRSWNDTMVLRDMQ